MKYLIWIKDNPWKTFWAGVATFASGTLTACLALLSVGHWYVGLVAFLAGILLGSGLALMFLPDRLRDIERELTKKGKQ